MIASLVLMEIIPDERCTNIATVSWVHTRGYGTVRHVPQSVQTMLYLHRHSASERSASDNSAPVRFVNSIIAGQLLLIVLEVEAVRR